MRAILAAMIFCCLLSTGAEARHIRNRTVVSSGQATLAEQFLALFRNGERTAATVAHNVGAEASDLYQRVTGAAIAAGVPVNIAHAIVRIESNYNPGMRGRAGEIGIMQIKPQTAAAMGENPFNVDGNLRAGMKYLALALRSSSDRCAAISGYNHGIGGRPYCTGYGRKVLALAAER